MNTVKILHSIGAALTVVALFPACESSGGGSGYDEPAYYPYPYHGTDGDIERPRPGEPPVRPSHPIATPPAMARPMPMPQPSFRR